MPAPTCTAFAGFRRIAQGDPVAVALMVKGWGGDETVLVFDDATGRAVDLDLRGDPAEIAARMAPPEPAPEPAPDPEPARTRGRPRLGVVAREVTLLPRHWDWLAAQPGGASQALRRLVDQARRADGGRTARRQAQERAYRVMSALLGDQPGFEEASRALFAGDLDAFAQRIAAWPGDARDHILALARAEEG